MNVMMQLQIVITFALIPMEDITVTVNLDMHCMTKTEEPVKRVWI